MTQTEILTVVQDAIYTIIKVAAPILIIGMAVGVIVSIFQATTQINEQTLAFVPKIVAILLGLLIFGGWMLTTLAEFTNRTFQYINTMLR